MRSNKVSVQIIVDQQGVYRVRLCGQSWDDEQDANHIYQKISHLVREIDRTMKEPDSVPRDTVM